MRIDSVRVGFSLVMLVGGAGVVLGACVSSNPGQPLVTSGGAGRTGTMAPDGGVDQRPARDAGGTVCTADGGAVAPPVMGGGPQPTDPDDEITRPTTPVPPLSGGTLLALQPTETTVDGEQNPERDQVHPRRHCRSSLVPRPGALQPGDEPGASVQDAAGRCTCPAPRRGDRHDRSDAADAYRRDVHRARGLHRAARDRLSKDSDRSTWPARAASSCRCPRRAGPRRGR